MENTKFTTGKVRLTYSSIWETKKEDGKDTEKFTACIIISKDDKVTVDRFKKGIADIHAFVKMKNKGKLPAGFKDGLRDAQLDENKKDLPAFENSYFVNLSTMFNPKVYDRNNNFLTDHSSVVDGDYIRLTVNMQDFDVNKNYGITYRFGSVQLIEKGEPLGNSGPAFDDEYSETSDSPFSMDDDQDGAF